MTQMYKPDPNQPRTENINAKPDNKVAELENKLNSLFGDKWHTPFKKWLQDNYSLDVKTIQ